MNHKLHNTILASAVVGAALLFGLLAAHPAAGGGYAASGHHDAAPGLPPGNMIAEDLRNDLTRDFERRSRQFESDLAAAGSAGEALAVASALFATSVVEATLATALEDVGRRQPPVPRAPATAGDAQPERPARSRSAMAMPYFSTARGLPRDNGE